MNYLQKNKSIKPTRSFFIGLLIFVILFFTQLLFYSSLSSISYTIAKPFWNLRDSIFGISTNVNLYNTSQISLLQNIKSLQAEMYNLQVENLELGAKVSAFLNPDLVSILESKGNKILAKVISKPPYSVYDSLILDYNKNREVNIGAYVYSGNNILIGKIAEVIGPYLKVSLLSSGFNSTPIDILRTGQTIELRGKGGGNFTAILPKDFDVSVGDFLVDTGVEQSIVAKVYYIDNSSLGSFKQVFARIPINFLKSQWVSISVDQ